MEPVSFFAELRAHLCGTMTPAYLLAAMIFLLIGAVLNIGIDVFNRDERSLNTPVTFSWAFFLRNNRLRFLFNLLAAYSRVRFFSDLFPGLKFSLSWAWMLGLVFDWVWVFLREAKYLAGEKLKMDLQAETLEKEAFIIGKGGRSDFGGRSFLEKVEANVLRKPFSKSEVEQLVAEALQGKTPEALQHELSETMKAFMLKTGGTRRKGIGEYIRVHKYNHFQAIYLIIIIFPHFS